ncbi:MAG TPA: hypothetical protein VMO20_08700 [Candidatus Acidoferrum sp.]|nr:hypothetical protein [Candidatus Acidoferrum sp.]
MNPNDIPQADWTLQFSMGALQWLELVVYLVGLSISIWAFRRSRKCGYLVIAIYFAVVALWLVFAVPVWRVIHAHDAPDISAQMEQKIQEAQRQAAGNVLAEEGRPPMAVRRRIYFPFGPIALVFGVWLLARRETPVP